MKKCKYCGTVNPDHQETCLSCGSKNYFNICINCGNAYEGQYCPKCGVRVGSKKKYCPKCGTEYYSKACPECGYLPTNTQSRTAPYYEDRAPETIIREVEYVTVPAGKRCDKWVAFLLCFFLGVFGGHKFYEGRIGMGILYIFTAGLFGIGAFVDLILILCKPNPYYV